MAKTQTLNHNRPPSPSKFTHTIQESYLSRIWQLLFHPLMSVHLHAIVLYPLMSSLFWSMKLMDRALLIFMWFDPSSFWKNNKQIKKNNLMTSLKFIKFSILVFFNLWQLWSGFENFKFILVSRCHNQNKLEGEFRGMGRLHKNQNFHFHFHLMAKMDIESRTPFRHLLVQKFKIMGKRGNNVN